MTREGHVRFWESVGVRFPRATRPYIKVKGKWAYLYRGVDKAGRTIDFYLQRFVSGCDLIATMLKPVQNVVLGDGGKCLE